MRTNPLLLALGLILAVQSGGCLGADEGDGDGDEEGVAAVSELGATTKRQLQYVVMAHPDDEIAAWSLIQRSPDNYPVFVLLTRGGESSYCTSSKRSANETRLGEARPFGDPYQGRWSDACRAARVQSWHRFLDAMADADPDLSKPSRVGRFSAPGLAGGRPPSRVDDGRVIESRSFEVHADESSARVVFDLGDGDLTSDEVTWAVQAVRARRRALFPRIREYGVIAASYRNVDPRCDVYDHTDHRAVHTAIFHTDQGTPGPQWGRTCIHDPDVQKGGRVADIDRDIFRYAMGVDAPAIDPARYPNARRTGAFQVHYGWLIDDYWPAGGLSGESLIARRQAFWARF